MTLFDDLRLKLQLARAKAELAQAAVIPAREWYERLKVRPGVTQDELDRAQKQADDARGEAVTTRAAELRAIEEFGTVSDPRTAITALKDRIPILMFPVRIETRFKQDTTPAQLLVRIYPDDCLVDTFDPMVSEDEARAARRFWEEMWAAGGRVARQRSAWRMLAGNSGPGRAEWIASQVGPQHMSDEITDAKAGEIILVIVTHAPLADKTAAGEFWVAVWRAGGKKDKVDAARDELVRKVGATRAEELIAGTKPVNFDAVPDAPLTRATAPVRPAFLILPPFDELSLKRHSWSSPARAALLPDRFVFIGRKGTNEVVKVGGPVLAPLVVSPDPTLPKDEQLRHGREGQLIFPDDMLWMTDFERAVMVGMGLRIDLDPVIGTDKGFDRVIVAGVRLSSDETIAQRELQSLLTHHRFSRAGLSIVPQGTPTNNTEGTSSGHSPAQDADDSFDDWKRGRLWQSTPKWDDKADGQWLAEYLGIEDGIVAHLRHSGRRDVAEARALNIAAWPGNLRQWMFEESQIFDDAAIMWTRGFFTDFVSGRGPLPALRIGNQPYGILPATAFSRSGWFLGDPALVRLPTLFNALKGMAADWLRMAANVSQAGRRGYPPQVLLDILGNHPASVDHMWRDYEWVHQYRDRLRRQGKTDDEINAIVNADRAEAKALLARLGYTGTEEWDRISAYYSHMPVEAVEGTLIDDRPLSETAPVRAYTNDGRNYLRWLIDAARVSGHEVLSNRGFKDDKPPKALLFKFLQIAVAHSAFNDAAFLPRQMAAVERLEKLPTARLERIFAEYLDCCGYRVDAWLMGVLRRQLAGMRSIDEAGTAVRKGIHLGAYAWVEPLTPDPPLSPATIPPEVLPDFDDPRRPLYTDSLNEGYVHAPSLNHAVTAAILRNGYISNATRGNPDTFAVNLTSRRVRMALSVLEGLRGGQSLGALLGYYFERGLHDRGGLDVELDAFIYSIRREFPLGSNRMASTQVLSDDMAIENIEARNVIDGLALVNYVRQQSSTVYPFKGKETRLRTGRPDQYRAITEETERLLELHDAIADLALSEGVFQAVLGNYDRLGATLDSLSKGTFPPEPQVVQTPIEGTGITHRVGVHLKPGLAPDFTPVSGVPATPRAMAEPAINEWIAAVLPPLDQIACVVKYRDGRNAARQAEVTLRALGLQPADVLRLAGDVRQQSATELDDRITARVAEAARPDAPVTIAYMETMTAGKISLFEALPLIHHLQRLTRNARPLASTDLTRPNDAKTAQDGMVFVDRERIKKTRDALETLRGELIAFARPIAAWLENPGAHRADILASCDLWIDAREPKSLPSLFGRAALFAIPQSGWAFGWELRKNVFQSVRAKAAEVIQRWNRKLADHDARIAQLNALPPSAPDSERFALLTRAESAVTTSVTAPLPATPADYRTVVEAKRAAFVTRRDRFVSLRDSATLTVKDVVAEFRALLPIAQFDLTEISAESEVDQCVLFAEDLVRMMNVVAADAGKRVAAADALLVRHDAAAAADARVSILTDAAKALLGDDVVIVPELTLGAAQGRELAAAHGASSSLLNYVRTKVEIPVDSWLYGVARVRERMRDWEQAVMFAGAFGRTEPELTPLQLPFKAGDSWMALELPPSAMEPRVERLLYTAHFHQAFDASKRQCGLLLDEWTEVIPGEETTTGVAVHYDRPNNEAPQAMLLLTPALNTGAWQWKDVVDALSETLDLAQVRAVEPRHLDYTPYSRFLPATTLPDFS